MMVTRSVRCPGKRKLQADRGGLRGMGMARPRCGTESPQHRPQTSSTRTVTDGSERVTQRLTPCPHWTPAHEDREPPSARQQGLMIGAARSRKRAKRRPRSDRLTPLRASQRSRLAGERMSQARRRSAGICALRPDDGRSVPEPSPQQSAKTVTLGQREQQNFYSEGKMTLLEKMKEMAEIENERMRAVCKIDPAQSVRVLSKPFRPDPQVRERRKKVLALKRQGYRYKDIAAAVGIPYSTVRADLTYARQDEKREAAE